MSWVSEVKTEYKSPCYVRQTNYVLKKQGDDFAKVFELCGKVEDDFRPICYVGLGNNAVIRSTRDGTTEGVEANEGDQANGGNQTEFIGGVCMLGQETEAQSRCFAGAVRQLIFFYDNDVQAKALCESLTRADWRAACLQITEEYITNGGNEQAKELCETFEADLRKVCLETAEEYSKTFRI